MRSNHAHLAAAFDGGFHHVADEGIIALALRRHAAMEPVELVRFRVSAPHLSSENGGFATTTSNFISASFSMSFGLPMVSPHSIRAASLLWTSMFIRHNAQVLPFISCP